MAEKIRIQDCEISLYAKADGDFKQHDHPARSTYAFVHQVHTPIIHFMQEHIVWQVEVQADALVTLQDFPVWVYVADCIPIVLVSKRCYGIIHGSRRTLHRWIIQETMIWMEKHQPNTKELSVRMWPCIKTYEVWKEFINYFPATFLTPNWEKYLFDLTWYANSLFVSQGIWNDQIIIDPRCTLANVELRSHRKWETGRNFVGVKRS